MRERHVSSAAITGGEEAEEAPRGPGGRKKGMGVTAWLLINASGETQVLEAGRHDITRRTGLPARDLRILDPQLSYPSTILGRERAIVINLEHIKAIITAHEVLLLNARDPAVAPFVEELQSRLARQEGGNSDMDMDFANKDNLRPTSFQTNPLLSSSGDNGELPQHQNSDENNLPGTWQDGSQLETNAFENSGPKVLPFEFRALEACLEAACRCLESETHTLEEEAYPALDELTSKISTLNLERVRQIKSRLVAISGRVQKVRDELEHLLDDDEDMAEMYLTDKLMQQHLDGTSSPSSLHGVRGGIDYELALSDGEDGRLVGERNTDSRNQPSTSASGFEGLSGTANALNGDDNSSTSSSTHSGTKILDVEELEMLLEAYFVQIDGTLNKLSTLREYVDDTEDYINILLDDKQNHLLQMGVMLTTAILVIGLCFSVIGMLSINIHIDLFTNPDDDGWSIFLWAVGGYLSGGLFLYIGAIAWYKHRGLLE